MKASVNCGEEKLISGYSRALNLFWCSKTNPLRRVNTLANLMEKMEINLLNVKAARQTITCSKPTIETLVKEVKYVER